MPNLRTTFLHELKRRKDVRVRRERVMTNVCCDIRMMQATRN